MKAFEIQVPGKVILTGEHAVIRGAPALVAPLWSRTLRLKLSLVSEDLRVETSDVTGAAARVVDRVVERALQCVGKSRGDLSGALYVDSTIPVGSGLGSSAALCVAIGKLFESAGWITPGDLFSFSRGLEDLFHGESSGVDIAVVLAGRPLCYFKNGDWSKLNLGWHPHFAVSDSGVRGGTSECVKKVKSLFVTDHEKARAIDHQMRTSADEMIRAFQSTSSVEGLPTLITSLNRAADCFERWGLVDSSLQAHMSALRNQGALAVKPTGSGSGGYVLSLWAHPPQDRRLDPVPLATNG